MFKRTAKPTREKKNTERILNNMTDFQKIKRALVEGGYVKAEDTVFDTCHFEVSEWDDSKYITLALCNNSVKVGFEFDGKGNLLFIS